MMHKSGWTTGLEGAKLASVLKTGTTPASVGFNTTMIEWNPSRCGTRPLLFAGKLLSGSMFVHLSVQPALLRRKKMAAWHIRLSPRKHRISWSICISFGVEWSHDSWDRAEAPGGRSWCQKMFKIGCRRHSGTGGANNSIIYPTFRYNYRLWERLTFLFLISDHGDFFPQHWWSEG